VPCLDADDVVEFVGGSLAPARAAETERHLDECDDCRALVSAIAIGLPSVGDQATADVGRVVSVGTSASPAPERDAALAAGTTVGRYIVQSQLGEGGMGIVYAAHDPELDRPVAIKLLHRNTQLDSARERLLREARALAKLSHPNIVSVFDVGTHQEQRAFLALELIDGESLTVWLAKPRHWREILGVFALAGRGLAAAHAAGIVHRDFKPDNVLVASDGRVCVSDFGLARAVSQVPATTPGPITGTVEPSLTRTGTLLGTPSYMAPEQLAGKSADEKSDQFSFCVALWEAVHREHPFGKRSWDELVAAVSAGRIAPVPASTRVPARLRRVLRTGLAVDPAHRYPSMGALLAALRRVAQRRSRWIVGGMVAGAIVAATITVLATRNGEASPCPDPGPNLAGVWNEAHRERVHRAFAVTGLPFAEDAWRGAADQLDRYGQGWVSMRREACEATAIRHEQSSTLLDRRMACLDDHLASVAALVDLFETGPSDVVQHAVSAAAQLPTLGACADRERLMNRPDEPAGPATRHAIESIRARLATVEALMKTGQYRSALAIVRPLAAEAERTGYRSLEARVSYWLGTALDRTDDRTAAKRSYEAALLAGEAGREDDAVAIAAIYLVDHVADTTQLADGERVLQRARAAVERIGHDDYLEAKYQLAVGHFRLVQGRYEDARVAFDRALDLARKYRGLDTTFIAAILTDTGLVYQQLGRPDQALARHREALAILERQLGPWHPDVSKSLEGVGMALSMLGKSTDAIAALERAASVSRRATGENSLAFADIQGQLANEYRVVGRYPDAERGFGRAIAVTENILGPDHPDLARELGNYALLLAAEDRLDERIAAERRALAIEEKAGAPTVDGRMLNLGAALHEKGRDDEALSYERRALAAMQQRLGPEHHNVAIVWLNMSMVLRAQGKLEEALTAATRALAIDDKVLPPDHPMLTEPLDELGRVLLGLGRGKQAIAPLERALAINLADPTTEPDDLGENRFLLAQALWDDGDRARARQLASAARAGYASIAAATPRMMKKLAVVDGWLKRH
jgi:tetratricopeptide (TPR) repeat protein